MQVERNRSLVEFCEEEGMDMQGLQKILDKYTYTGKIPLRDDIINVLENKPKLFERTTVIERILARLKGYVERFE
jgi:type I restriction enzyme R subunit